MYPVSATQGKLVYLVLTILGMITVMSLSACATLESGPVYHAFVLDMAKGNEPVKNLRYRYGDIGWREKQTAFPGPLATYVSDMTVPEEFEIGWVSNSGKQYEFKVPVRSRLSSSVKRKTVRFVIVGDHVEGYLGVREERYGPLKYERFY